MDLILASVLVSFSVVNIVFCCVFPAFVIVFVCILYCVVFMVYRYVYAFSCVFVRVFVAFFGALSHKCRRHSSSAVEVSFLCVLGSDFMLFLLVFMQENRHSLSEGSAR